jgi:hypothetical protein
VVKIYLKTNVSFLITFLSVFILAILQGGSISKSLLGNESFHVNNIQIVAFLILTLIILIVVTFHPDKIYLSAYSSMTLGLVVIISAFYNLFIGYNGTNVFQFILGFILMISGYYLYKGNKLSRKDEMFVKKGIEYYSK